MKTVLIVEDDPDFGAMLIKKFKKDSYHPLLLKDGWETLTYLLGEKKEKPVAVVLDLMLPGRTGHELINAIRSVLPEAKVFIFSSHQRSFTLIPKNAVSGFFEKKDGIDAVVRAVNQALGKES